MDWHESLSTGVELIDSQHRSLIDGVNEVRRTGARGGVLKSAMAMDALRMYVTVHFSTEEDLLRQHGFPDLDAHIAEHREFVLRLDALLDENLRHDNSDAIVAFFETWLTNHLCQSDMVYVPYLKVMPPA